MKLSELFRSAFTAAKEEGLPLDGVASDTSADDALASLNPPDPRVAEMQQQLEAHKAQIAAMQAAAVQKDAEAFATAQIAAHRAFPAEYTAIAALYVASANTGSLDAVRSAYNARPAHELIGERIADGQLYKLGEDVNQKDDAQAAEQRRKALLALTPLGQAALKNRGAN